MKTSPTPTSTTVAPTLPRGAETSAATAPMTAVSTTAPTAPADSADRTGTEAMGTLGMLADHTGPERVTARRPLSAARPSRGSGFNLRGHAVDLEPQVATAARRGVPAEVLLGP